MKRLILNFAKIASIFIVTMSANSAAKDVTIHRDEFGVPHIFSDRAYGLFYGYGYAIAQDRLYQLDMARYSTQGRVSEVLGEEFFDFDKKTRQNYSPASIAAQLRSLPAEDLEILEGYADGVNRWISEINKAPEKLMPREYIENGLRPQKWDSFDVAMIFIGTMINRFGDYNTEIDNQTLYSSLQVKHGKKFGKDLFDLLLSRNITDAPTTIAGGEWESTSDAYLKASSEATVESSLDALMERTIDGYDPMGSSADRAFSNIIVLGTNKSSEAKSILINGPQFGFFQPAYTYSVGLHGAGYDVVGNSPFGYPLVQFGHNQKIAWGSTWGAVDNVDLYQLRLNPKNPEEYFYQGIYRPLERRNEILKIKDQQDRQITVYRSVQGAVVDYRPSQGVAFAKRRAWEGKEVSTLLAWNKVGKAKNHEQWLEQVSESAINVNWYYADQDGNIAYALGGRYPIRVLGHDNRLPAPGDGKFEWQGFMPFTSNPKVYNPESGFIANWNNKPADGVQSPDQWWYSWNNADRVELLNSRLGMQTSYTPEEAWSLMMESAFEDPNARFFVPRLVKIATSSRDPRMQEAGKILAEWDYMDRDMDADGLYDHPAIPIFRGWLDEFLSLTFAELLPAQHLPWFVKTDYLSPGSSTTGSQNISVGAKIVHQAITAVEQGAPLPYEIYKGRNIDSLIAESLAKSIAKLALERESDMKSWRLGIAHTTYYSKNFLGVPQASSFEEMRSRLAMNRGTENNITVFDGQGVKGYEVTPPGQSGFISPDGKRSVHFDDQISLFDNMGKRRTWLSTRDIFANRKSTEHLSIDH